MSFYGSPLSLLFVFAGAFDLLALLRCGSGNWNRRTNIGRIAVFLFLLGGFGFPQLAQGLGNLPKGQPGGLRLDDLAVVVAEIDVGGRRLVGIHTASGLDLELFFLDLLPYVVQVLLRDVEFRRDSLDIRRNVLGDRVLDGGMHRSRFIIGKRVFLSHFV